MHRAARPLSLLLCALLALPAAAAPPKAKAITESTASKYGDRQDVRDFVFEVAQRRQWSADWVQSQLNLARPQPTAQRLMMPAPAGTAKNWAAYRERFVEPQRIQAGLRFWQENADWLQRAERRYGVPAEIVVGIIGVETFYGRITGNFRVLDVLTTLSFDFPNGRSDRSPFFREQLEEFLAMCLREGIDPASAKGSYAGAMGLPQFMPSSINSYAVDFDDDGRIDLLNSNADVIGSVARYLAAFGWVRGMPTHYAVTPPSELRERALLLVPDIVPSFSAAQMSDSGAVLDAAGRQHDGPLALVQLENGGNEPSYVAGTQNFYVVTRYNWSSYYALAVIDLGAAVSQLR
jgi:membrane-bound lytic murein transglycosylase B